MVFAVHEMELTVGAIRLLAVFSVRHAVLRLSHRHQNGLKRCDITSPLFYELQFYGTVFLRRLNRCRAARVHRLGARSHFNRGGITTCDRVRFPDVLSKHLPDFFFFSSRAFRFHVHP